MARSGKSGKVKVGDTYLSEVMRWTLEQEAEVTKHGVGGFKIAVVGVIDIKGSFECLTNPPDVGTQVTLILEEGEGGTNYTGTAVIKKVSEVVVPDTGETIKYSVDFEGSGTWALI